MELSSNLIKFNIDVICENIEGWAYHVNGLPFQLIFEIGDERFFITPNLPREDVNVAHGVLNCGFSFHRKSLSGEKLTVSAELNGDLIVLAEQAIDTKAYQKSIEVGLGYHFLINDSNKVRDMLSFGRQHKGVGLDSIVRNLDSIANRCSMHGVDFSFFVIPEKNHILQFLEPNFKITDDRICNSLSALNLGYFNYCFDYFDALEQNEKLLLFTKNDNHLSAYGINKFLELYFRTRIPGLVIPQLYPSIEYGDLNGKAEQTVGIKVPDHIMLSDPTEDNLINNRKLSDSIITALNTGVKERNNLFLLGTSSARKFLYSLSFSFSKINMRWGGDAKLNEILESECTHFYIILPERFIYPVNLAKILQ